MKPEMLDAFRHLTAVSNFHEITRVEWRTLAFGAEREQVQQHLLELARTNPGTQADKLTLMKAAHAVLPLHGGDLHELAGLLASTRPVPLEWCDVLLCQLAVTGNTVTTQASPLLDALRDGLQQPVTSPLAAQNRTYLLDRIRHLGYRPAWLDAIETP